MTSPNPASCERGCASMDDCTTACGRHPPWLMLLDVAELDELLGFANRVQHWSLQRDDMGGTFGEAAEHFRVPVQRIHEAVTAHYWMFTNDTDRPLAARRIDHEGE
jgi:hypothetical protein